MTWFSSMIPGAPGNADSIASVAQALHASATEADTIEQAVSRIPSSISTWKGHAHLDYLESQQRARSRMIHFQRRHDLRGQRRRILLVERTRHA